MNITNIEPQKKRKNRYNVYIDGKFYFGLDEGVVLKFGLRKGIDIDQELIGQIEKEEVFAKVYNATIRFLKTRERSIKEISDKLKSKDYNGRIIEGVLAKLEKYNFVNDERFCRLFIADRMSLKPKGKKALRIELLQKGIDDKTINMVLEEILDAETEEDLAKRVFEKASKKYSGISEKERKQKIIKYMMSRGFEWNMIEKFLITNYH